MEIMWYHTEEKNKKRGIEGLDRYEAVVTKRPVIIPYSAKNGDKTGLHIDLAFRDGSYLEDFRIEPEDAMNFLDVMAQKNTKTVIAYCNGARIIGISAPE